MYPFVSGFSISHAGGSMCDCLYGILTGAPGHGILPFYENLDSSACHLSSSGGPSLNLNS